MLVCRCALSQPNIDSTSLALPGLRHRFPDAPTQFEPALPQSRLARPVRPVRAKLVNHRCFWPRRSAGKNTATHSYCAVVARSTPQRMGAISSKLVCGERELFRNTFSPVRPATAKATPVALRHIATPDQLGL